MKRRAAAIVCLAVAPLFTACAVQPPQVALAPTPPIETPLAAPETTPPATPMPEPTTATPEPTPSVAPVTSATATPKPTPKATAKPTSAKPTTAKPKASSTPKPTKAASTKPAAPAAPVDVGACTGQSLALNAKGGCVQKAQEILAGLKLFVGTPNGTFGQSTANAVLNYQRSRGITDNAIIGPETWAALASGRGPGANAAPASCRAAGVVLCASKGNRTLTLLRDGQAVKTINVRFGGMTKDDNGKLRIFPTVSGRYSVYAKDAKAFSDRWEASMPYSIKFNPNMYVHYSGDFAKRGYAGSSHGCINVASLSDAKWFFDNTPVGAKVVVY
ncbi:L,D-transpeptidase family protein [Propioniciclava coleopterorum]|uniref:L,D-transpeptidase family protein n=1 Tax=Propioniciclava coleopterorum TaxID=2714937 RepID=A0A6G7Y7G6_9ACTN|nr:L,D-transpeptidase family protein [Propioniciclava coleopterorum]QIK72733.1 L,D-transpeptidase family protein [Propioniciclava coleopterorum]